MKGGPFDINAEEARKMLFLTQNQTAYQTVT
jgi:hypothetical protein